MLLPASIERKLLRKKEVAHLLVKLQPPLPLTVSNRRQQESEKKYVAMCFTFKRLQPPRDTEPPPKHLPGSLRRHRPCRLVQRCPSDQYPSSDGPP